MKRFLIAGLVLMGVSSIALAQDDDIYATGNGRKKNRNEARANEGGNDTYQHDDFNDDRPRNNFHRGSDGNNTDAYSSYDNPDDYIDDDDLTYSARINRFYYPFNDFGYYNVFYNPFWYNRNWCDPYSGWNPWRPQLSFSFGFGPYWSSNWGWSAWYGYNAWPNYWYSPYYGCGSYYGGGFGGYYGGGGYWNNYYSGVDHRYAGNGSGVNYGPRQVFRPGMAPAARSGSGIGFRPAGGGSVRPSPFNSTTSAPRQLDTRGGGFSNNMSPRGGGQPVQSAGQARQGGFGRGISRFFSNANTSRTSPSGGPGVGRGLFGGGGASSPRTSGGGGNSAPSRSFGGGGATRSSGGSGSHSSGGGRTSGGHGRR